MTSIMRNVYINPYEKYGRKHMGKRRRQRV